MTSAILTKFSETYPEVITTPQIILGPNYLKVLEFWKFIDNLSDPEKKEISDPYWTLDNNVRKSAELAAWNAAEEVVGGKIEYAAWYAAVDVLDNTGCAVFGWATLELIGDVDNKVAYNLIMSHKTF